MSELGSIGSNFPAGGQIGGAERYRRLDRDASVGPDRPGDARRAEGPVARGVDRAEISQIARQLADEGEATGIRSELVERIKGEIAAGTYDTDEKLNAAIDGLIDDLRLDA